MDSDQVLAFRLARSGLAGRDTRSLAAAAACPASDFARDAALLALAARMEDLSREDYERAVDAGELVVAHVVRGAIHALAPADFALYGRALLAGDDAELAVQLGRQVRRLAEEHGFAVGEALEEVAGATEDALARGRSLDKNELHEELRQRVRPGPDAVVPRLRQPPRGSHAVALRDRQGRRAPDSDRRYRLGSPGRAPRASEAVGRFLRFYGPSRPGEFAEWAGLARPHADRLWERVAGELAEVRVGSGKAWLMSEDVGALESPPPATGIRLLPPGDPYLQKPNRPLLTPDPELRKRLFRPVASPGAVLRDGRLAGLWRGRAKGRKLELTVEAPGRLPHGELEEQAQRLAALRGATEAALVVA